MKALKALVLRMVAGLDLKGLEKMKAEEAEDILLLLDDRGYLDVKPDVDENLTRKKDHKGVEKVKDDLDKLKFSETEENDENCVKLKETEEVYLIKTNLTRLLMMRMKMRKGLLFLKKVALQILHPWEYFFLMDVNQ